MALHREFQPPEHPLQPSIIDPIATERQTYQIKFFTCCNREPGFCSHVECLAHKLPVRVRKILINILVMMATASSETPERSAL